MKTLIYYASKTGATSECVERLVDLLEHHQVTVVQHGKKLFRPDPNKYECIIIGGSIHAHKVQKPIVNYIKSNSEILKKKKLGLFLCCLTPTDKASQYFDDNYPASVIEHASAIGLFGGAVYYNRMNIIERKVLQSVTGKKENYKEFLDDNIKKFIKELCR